MPLLEGKVAIITGAGSAAGQGGAEATLFAAEGALGVVVADLAASEGEVVAASLGDRGMFVPTDVTDIAAWQDLRTRALERFGSVDVLVNNAGIWLAKGLTETSPAEYAEVVAVNQTGVYLGMHVIGDHMKQQRRGSIVNISSTSGLKGGGMPFAYAASKWAVRGMTRAAAWELAPFGVRVNAVCPGFIDTPMIEGGPEVLDHLATLTPGGRVGEPQEVARTVAFLASDSASYISGAEVAVDFAFTA